MKKAFALCLGLIMALTLLAACGAKPSPSAPEAVSAVSEAAVVEPESSSAIEEPASDTPDSEPADGGDVPLRGNWEGNVYTNTYTGVTFTAPEDWLVLSDDELAQAVGIGTENMTVRGEEMSPEMLAQSTIYDACVANMATGTNVIFALENLTASHPLGGAITPQAYLTSSQALIEENFPDMYTFGEPYSQTIGGNEYLLMEANAPENEMTQLFMVRKVDNYMLLNNITLLGGDTADDVLPMFS